VPILEFFIEVLLAWVREVLAAAFGTGVEKLIDQRNRRREKVLHKQKGKRRQTPQSKPRQSSG
jgi:hypothetical protein